ncbi:MAG TPA: branched-chain amino acid ABC transporter permease [Thermoprotei archaeon]|nr:branched-chain amino acid ABC transporter permease [Thermoprotei archaeon]
MLEVILPAIVISSGIALSAAGITIIYMSTETFNFAHASFTTLGFFIVYQLILAFGGNPYLYFIPAAILTGLVGVTIYLTVNRWLLMRGARMVTLMMSTLGVDLILFGLINHWADYIRDVFGGSPRSFLLRTYDFEVAELFGVSVKAIVPISIITVLIIIVAIHTFLTKTKFGVAMRTAIENPTLARIMGVNIEYVYLTAWFLGGALAGLGGAVLAMVETGSPFVGIRYIVPLFAGSIVGGLYSVFGSLLGGFLIGMSQQVGIYILSINVGAWVTGYRPLIPLIIMVIALLFFPEGLGGIKWSQLRSKIRLGR